MKIYEFVCVVSVHALVLRTCLHTRASSQRFMASVKMAENKRVEHTRKRSVKNTRYSNKIHLKVKIQAQRNKCVSVRPMGVLLLVP